MESTRTSDSGATLRLGYVCAFVSLLFFPPAFGLAGFILGIVNITKGQVGHGVAQIVLSVTCAIFGMILGAAMFVSSQGY